MAKAKRPVDLKKLPKPAKVAAVKMLRQFDFRILEIADILGIPKTTVHRYIHEKDEVWEKVGSEIKKLVEAKEEVIAAKALAAIEKKMDRARFYELVGLYKVIRELRMPKVAIAQQINIQPILGGKSRDAGHDSGQQNHSDRQNS